jgi:hypothetical protein
MIFLDSKGKSCSIVSRYIGSVGKSSLTCPLPLEEPCMWKTSEVLTSDLTSAPWEFNSGGKSLVGKLKKWPSLEAFAQVYKGTGTNADRVYLLESRAEEDGLLLVYSFEKK